MVVETARGPDPAIAAEPCSVKAEVLLAERLSALHARTDRMFAWLMACQWLGALCAALWVSPYGWAGTQSDVHLHVWAALLLGGALCSAPMLLVALRPGAPATRHVIAVAQVLMSALLIHLTGGRIETHFHVFVSLAFLAFYHDWRLLVSASAVIAVDHLIRGLYWPYSVYGEPDANGWRWLEHAGWVVFEDIGLLLSVRRGRRQMHEIARREAQLTEAHAHVELRVAERTAELEREIAARTQAERERDELYRHQVLVSRDAGRAEIATSVLHNVGNVLNSVNVAASLALDRAGQSHAEGLRRLLDLLREHAGDLAGFLAGDNRGQQVLTYLDRLDAQLRGDRESLIVELRGLVEKLAHVKEVVATQQSYARVGGVLEAVQLTNLVEDALKMTAPSLTRHEVAVERDYATLPAVTTDRHKVLQILVNLISNAKHALREHATDERRIVMRVRGAGDHATVEIQDNGIGIAPEDLSRVFQHGFTTRKTGHGFGLHASVLAAKELGGSLRAHSDGRGRGARFTLDLPLVPPAAAPAPTQPGLAVEAVQPATPGSIAR